MRSWRTRWPNDSLTDLVGANAASCSIVVSVDALISHTPLEATGGETLYVRWRGASRQR